MNAALSITLGPDLVLKGESQSIDVSNELLNFRHSPFVPGYKNISEQLNLKPDIVPPVGAVIDRMRKELVWSAKRGRKGQSNN